VTREKPAICAVCGRTIDRGVAPDLSGRCERCAESAPVRSDDRGRRERVRSLSSPRKRRPAPNLYASPRKERPDPERDETLDQRRPNARRDAALERLRQRYCEARALIATDESDPDHRAQLDWIFGIDDDDARGTASLDARTSELVVLWLEDLVRHLEELAAWGPDPRDPGNPASPSQRAARGLHAATREFADALRRAADGEFRP
jgi:hypothetical protein